MKKPFYREARKCWYVKDARGRFIRLDPNEKKAYRLWEDMRRLADYRHHDASLDAILEAFLRDLEPRITPERMVRYILFCNGFAEFMGRTSQARKVTGSDILRWVKKPKNGKVWSIARQRDAGQAIKRALSWAIRRGYLPWSDLLELRFQQPKPRTSTLSKATHLQLIQACREQPRSRSFALVLIALRLSPARPIQVREVTAANFTGSAWVFSDHKTAGKTGQPLVIHCAPCLATLTRILAYFRPSGPLFLTSLGDPWTKDGIVRRFRRIREKIGIENVTAYTYRHSFATDALESGTDLPTVAALLGHSDTAMVSRVYGHLDQRTRHLQDATSRIQVARMQQEPR
jgi:integrase